MSGWFLLSPCFIEIPVFDANNVDSHQTLVSDLNLRCLPMSLLWDLGINGFTLSMPQAMIIGHNEPSHQDLHCLTFSFSTSQINLFHIDSLLKKNRADDKCMPSEIWRRNSIFSAIFFIRETTCNIQFFCTHGPFWKRVYSHGRQVLSF